MGKLLKLSLPILVAGSLAACSDGEEAAEKAINQEKNYETEPPKVDPDAAAVPFNSFELEVDYDGLATDYSAEYEKFDDGLDAKIDDEINERNISGHPAFDKLLPVFEKLEFTSATKEEDIIKEVIQDFGLPENYEEFELEAEMSNGEKVEATDEK